MSRLMSRTLCSIGFALLMASNVAANHPGHVSSTEVEWNPKSKRFEIAMRVRFADLEDAIALQQSRRISIEHDNAGQRFVRDYLGRHFSIGPDNSQCVLHWVGMELQLHDVWIYFEAEICPDASIEKTGDQPVDAQPRSGQQAGSWNELFRSHSGKADPGPTEFMVRNTLLTDVQPEQTNVVSLKWNSSAHSIVLTHDQPEAHVTPGGVQIRAARDLVRE